MRDGYLRNMCALPSDVISVGPINQKNDLGIVSIPPSSAFLSHRSSLFFPPSTLTLLIKGGSKKIALSAPFSSSSPDKDQGIQIY